MNRKFRESTYIQIIFLIYVLRYGLELNFLGVNSYLPDIQYLPNNYMLLLTSIAIVSAHFVNKFYHNCIIHDVYDQCNAYHIKLGSPFLSLLAFTSIDIQMQNTSSIITLQRMIKKMPVLFKYLNDSFKNNDQFLCDIRRYEGVSVFRYAHPDMVRDAIKGRVILLGDVSDELRADKVFVKMAVQVDSQNFLAASDELKADKEFVLAVIEKNPSALQFANTNFRDDREVVMAAVKRYRLALQYASARLQNDKAFVLAVIEKNPSALKFANKNFRDDRKVVMAAVKSYGLALQYASDELRDDREVVLAAVTSNGSALEYASDELRADKEFMMAVVTSNGSALKFANTYFRADREVMMAAVKNYGLALRYASAELRNDKEVILAALWSREYSVCKVVGKRGFLEVLKDAENLKEISFANALEASTNELKADREVVEAVLAIDGMALEFVSKDLRADEEIVRIALKQNPESIKWSMCPILGLKFLIDEYENNQATVEDTVANIVAYTEKDIFKRHYKTNLDFLSDLVETRFKNKSDFDILAKKLFAALDITIENMYKLLPQEDFKLFKHIYDIYLRELFNNHEVYPGDEEKVIEYADDYMRGISDMRNEFPRCIANFEMAFHFLKGHYPNHLSKSACNLSIKNHNKHPFQDRPLKHDDIVALDDQKLKYCNQALIYGFKIHTLDVLYKKDPKSPLIKRLLTTFNEEDKTKDQFKAFQEKLNTSFTMLVSMFENKEIEQNGIASDLTSYDLNK